MSAKFPRGGEQGLFWPAVYHILFFLSFINFSSFELILYFQVSIGRVHVRYEDMVTNPDHPFACGIMLKHISAYTTNSKWQAAQLDNSATVIYKVRVITIAVIT